MLSEFLTGFLGARSFLLASTGVSAPKIVGEQRSLCREGTGLWQQLLLFLTVPMARQTLTVLSYLLLPTMTYSASLVVIPLLAIAYLLLIYGMLVLAQRLSTRRRSQG